MADEASGGADSDPASATGGVGFVVAFPGELGAGSTVAAAVTDVEPAFDRTEDDFALEIALKGDMGGFDQIEVVVGPGYPSGDGRSRLACRHRLTLPALASVQAPWFAPMPRAERWGRFTF